jgi:hypothetical protein
MFFLVICRLKLSYLNFFLLLGTFGKLEMIRVSIKGIGTILRFFGQLKLTGTHTIVPHSPCTTLHLLLLLQCLTREYIAMLMHPFYQISLPWQEGLVWVFILLTCRFNQLITSTSEHIYMKLTLSYQQRLQQWRLLLL